MSTESIRPFLVLSIAITLLVVPATSGLAGSTDDGDGCEAHPPIHIRHDEQFRLPGSGVVNPNAEGTEGDPFVIEGWCFMEELGVGVDVPMGWMHPVDDVESSAVSIQGTSSHVLVQDNVIAGFEGSGLELVDAENVTIQQNNITDNGKAGVFLSSSDSNVAQNNNVTNNGNGVYLSSSSEDNVISENRLDNSYRGVWMVDSNHNVVQDNTITDHGSPSVWLTESDGNVVRGNTVTDNQNHGILLSGSTNVVHGNNISDNADTGMRVVGNENIIHNNTITQNREEFGNGGHGIRVSCGSWDTAVRDNLIARNEGDGVFLWTSLSGGCDDDDLIVGTVLVNNNIEGNAGYGLNANNHWGSVDATHNWWGHETGPSGGMEDACTGAVADGDGQSIGTEDGTDVCFDPWLTEPNPDAGAGSN